MRRVVILALSFGRLQLWHDKTSSEWSPVAGREGVPTALEAGYITPVSCYKVSAQEIIFTAFWEISLHLLTSNLSQWLQSI